MEIKQEGICFYKSTQFTTTLAFPKVQSTLLVYFCEPVSKQKRSTESWKARS